MPKQELQLKNRRISSSEMAYGQLGRICLGNYEGAVVVKTYQRFVLVIDYQQNKAFATTWSKEQLFTVDLLYDDEKVVLSNENSDEV